MKHVDPSARAFILKDSGGDDPAAIVQKALADLQGSVESRLKAIETKGVDAAQLQTRIDELETRLNRPGVAGAHKDADVERKAFEAFVRKGVEAMPVELKTALTVGTDATAGYLAPPMIAAELLKKLIQYSPIRNYARVVTIGASAVKYPRRVSTTTATWVSETGARSASNPTYEQIEITPHELATYVDVSNALLEDNNYNLEAELASDLAEQFGVAEGSAFVAGDGNGKPFGLLTASGIAQVTTGNASGFPSSNPADVLIGMFHTLPNVHAQNAAWIMNRNTLAVIRKFKDAQGRYLVLDGLADGAPVTLLGRPIVEAIDMPDVGAGNTPIILGDLQGYRIVDRIGFALLRDPFTQATSGITRMHSRRRVGADCTHPDRFLKLACSV